LEVLFPEKNVTAAHFGSTVPGKKMLPQCILEVLFPEKTSALIALIASERSNAGPIFPFFIFIFLGIVLPFFRGQYFHFVIFP
jgi:hypothetical protein